MTIKAYAINTIKIAGETHLASTSTSTTIFDVPDQETFDRLENLGAIRKPTKEELILAKAAEDEANGINVLEKTAAAAVEPTVEETKAPASGAKGDPNGKPKGAKETKTAEAADDLGV